MQSSEGYSGEIKKFLKSLPKWSVQGIEENDRKGKTRDLFKKIRDTKGLFHAKWAQ